MVSTETHSKVPASCRSAFLKRFHFIYGRFLLAQDKCQQLVHRVMSKVILDLHSQLNHCKI